MSLYKNCACTEPHATQYARATQRDRVSRGGPSMTGEGTSDLWAEGREPVEDPPPYSGS